MLRNINDGICIEGLIIVIILSLCFTLDLPATSLDVNWAGNRINLPHRGNKKGGKDLLNGRRDITRKSMIGND